MTPSERSEAEARAINGQPWEPPPGMMKKQCAQCRYFFAVPVVKADTTSRCRLGCHATNVLSPEH